MEKSQNGWKASKNPQDINIKSFPIAGTNLHIRCEATAGIVLAAFASEFHKKVEPLDQGALDDWGYAYRPVRGQTTGLSNHASGTAIDLNASKHPLGKKDTFSISQKLVLQELVKKYGLRWGGNYISRTDEMHVEVIETTEQLMTRIKKLGLK